jgi:hypothetical protein
LEHGRSATLVANRTSVVDPLQHALSRGKTMFAARAFWHWYLQHGMEEDTLIDAFESIEMVVANYVTV